MLSTTKCETCAIALVIAALAAAGCGGAAAGGSSATTSSASSEHATDSTQTTQATQTTLQLDPAVAQWAHKWKHKVGQPTRRAVARMAANARPAAAGDVGASYRLMSALNVLSNCRLPLETSMVATPEEMQQARKMTKAARRMIYVGTDRVVQALNAQSPAMATDGAQRVRQGLALLMRAGHEVDRAATPQ